MGDEEKVIAGRGNANISALFISAFQGGEQPTALNRSTALMTFVSRVALVLFASLATAAAAELAGVVMPDKQDVAGYHLVLNGVGLRTYSLLRVHVYVAGLYLERRSADANAILASTQPKLIRFTFLRDVNAEDARRSWREALARNCPAPCRLPADSIARFLAAIPSVHSGDTNTLLFTVHGVEFFINGRSAGHIANSDFKEVILSTFIGPSPTSEEVKAGLLGAQG